MSKIKQINKYICMYFLSYYLFYKLITNKKYMNLEIFKCIEIDLKI